MTTTPDMTATTRAHLLWLAAQPGFEGLREGCKCKCHKPASEQWLYLNVYSLLHIKGDCKDCQQMGYVLPSAPECLWRLDAAIRAHSTKWASYDITTFPTLEIVTANVYLDKNHHGRAKKDDDQCATPLDAIALATVRALGGPE